VKIAIVGSGRIGAGLGRAWARAGHVVTFAVRQPADPKHADLLRETGATASAVGPALAAADVVVLAVPFGAVSGVAKELPDWNGKVVIDCTNAIGPGFTLLVGHTDSSAEVNARLLPGARLVKSFTAQGAENLANPVYGGVAAANFYCGDDADAKAVVRQLIVDVGFEPVTLVWFAASRALGSREIGFNVLRRPPA
jgi:predicted dinucleotide-binding enzyme